MNTTQKFRKKYFGIIILSVIFLSMLFASCGDEETPFFTDPTVTPTGIVKLYTSNAGETWEGAIIWPFPSAVGFDIDGIGGGYLNVVGKMQIEGTMQGLILSSSDGGDSWLRQASNLQLGNLNSVCNTFYTFAAGENSSLAYTRDLGVSWSNCNLNSSFMNFRSVAFNYEGIIGVAVGDCMLGANDTSFVYRSTDMGQTWTKISTELFFTDYRTFNDVVFTGNQTAVAVSDWGSFMATTDAGLTWFITESVTSQENVQSISIPFNSDIGYAAGGGRILKTFDKGINWHQIYSGTKLDLLDIEGGGNIAIAVGYDGTILKTMDGGEMWARKDPPADFNYSTFRGITRVDSLHWYIVGGD
jgi:photosystem II stability/assembly factor-like uncharacterized protein